MTKVQRFNSFLVGLFTLALGVLMIVHPEAGMGMISVIICVSLITMGINKLIFYFLMSRHMVGGIRTLIIGLLMLDLGVYAVMLKDFPVVYIIIYLLVIHAFSGVLDIMGAIDALKSDSRSWRLNMVSGVVNIAVAVIAVIYGFVKGDMVTVVYLYAVGICYSGIIKMINSFRRTAVAYIQ